MKRKQWTAVAVLMAVILAIVWASTGASGGAGKRDSGRGDERVSHGSGGGGSPGSGPAGTKPEASAVSPSAAATAYTLAPAPAQEPKIHQVTAAAPTVGLYEKLELSIALTAEYSNPYDPQELDLGARLTAPSGANWDINGFYDGAGWKLRFSPDEPGEWTYTLHVQDRNGRTEDSPRSFTATTSAHRGWIGVAADNPRFLAYRNGSPFYGVGVAYPWGITESGLDLIAANGGNLVTYWNGNYDNAGSGGGGEQLESVASGLGRYDMRKAARIDELLEWFEARDMQMSFVIWPHDSLADKIDWPAQWSKNAYSTLGEAVDFYASEAMWKQQEKLYRYLIARYGYSRSLGIWDLICEVTGTDGYALGDKSKADVWLTRVHQYFKTNDPYNHPTMGSAAGNAEDYWEHAYRTLDLADRENYYSLHYRAYAEDISERWTYGKPLMIGETGNVADAAAYHNMLWVTLASGLASTPIWWDVTKVDEVMYHQMKVFAAFVAGLDLAEPRTPVTLLTDTFEQKLPRKLSLADGQDAGNWSLPDWAPANKDSEGSLAAVHLEPEGAGGVSVRTSMTFAGGEYSQGVLQQTLAQPADWSGYDELNFDVYVGPESPSVLKAKAVLFPSGQWTEAEDAYDVPLVAGKWTPVRIKLADTQWLNRKLTAADLRQITSWALKVYAISTPVTGPTVDVVIRNPRLTAAQAPVAVVQEAEGWMMQGAGSSYGWMISGEGNLSGRTAKVPGWPADHPPVRVHWYDPWSGQQLAVTSPKPVGGNLLLTAPLTERLDLAFTLEPQF